MDIHADLPEVEHGGNELHDFRSLGLLRLTPINPEHYSPLKMQTLWENVQKCDYVFDDFCRNDATIFACSLADPDSLHFEIDTRGYCVIRNVTRSDNAYIHYCIWDREMPFKEVLLAGRELIDFLFKRLKVARCTATIPVYNTQAIKFAKLLGFKFEGELRNAILYHEKHYNVDLYGLLRTEWERGTLSRAV